MTLASGANDLGTTAGITLGSGEGVDLTGVSGVYTGTSSTVSNVVVTNLNGIQNLEITAMRTYASAATSGANTIIVTLDGAPVTTVPSEWTVDINAGTPNVVTQALISGSTVVLTVADAITTGQVVTVTHTARSSSISAFADQAVTNNE